MQLADIKKLADLARVDITEEELSGLIHDFDSILAYVGQVQDVSESSDVAPDYPLYNVMREDVATNKTGEYTDKILAQMPNTHDGFLKVKQIL